MDHHLHSEWKPSGSKQLVVTLLDTALTGVGKMLRESARDQTILPAGPLTREEAKALAEVIWKLAKAHRELVSSGDKEDVPIEEICDPQWVEVIRRSGIRTLMGLWECNPDDLPGLYERCRTLSGKKPQPHMYYFINKP